MKPPIEVAHLFPIIDEKLIALLKTLTPAEWQLITLAKPWTVKDVAAHLLDGNMRAISARQGHDGPPAPAIHSYEELVVFLNDLNASWVKAMQRVSTSLLIELLENTGRQYSTLMAAAPLFETARFSVAWAGEESSVNWFHLAREYSEKMHHQLQILHALNKESELLEPVLFFPFIATLMYGIPHALRNTIAAEETTIQITINGDAGGHWFAKNISGKWAMVRNDQTNVIAAEVRLSATDAWKLFTKGITASEAIVQKHGDEKLCDAVLGMIAVMA
ncbi:MAG: maleylpyruvate isomerase N-terminal domain-containing protein [Bacteroidota bacterium]